MARNDIAFIVHIFNSDVSFLPCWWSYTLLWFCDLVLCPITLMWQFLTKTWLLPSHGNHSCHLHATSEIPRTLFPCLNSDVINFFYIFIFYFILFLLSCLAGWGCSPYQTLEYSYSQLMAICLLHMFFDLSIGFRHWSAKQVCLWEAMGVAGGWVRTLIIMSWDVRLMPFLLGPLPLWPCCPYY